MRPGVDTGSFERRRQGVSLNHSRSFATLAAATLYLTTLVAGSAAQTPAPPCRPRTVTLRGPTEARTPWASLQHCRHADGSTELLAEVTAGLGDVLRPVSTGMLTFTARDIDSASWRFAVDGSARRAIVTRRRGEAEPHVVPADSAPWRAAVLVSTDSLWRVHGAWPAGLTIDSVVYIAPTGERWSLADVESIARTTRTAAVAQPPSDSSAGTRTTHWNVHALGNAATPAPHAVRPGARASLGLVATHSRARREITIGIAPPRPVFDWAPIEANPNQRGRRVLRDGRPEMEPWRVERGRFVWLDTRRIDRGLGLAHLHGDGSPVGALVTADESGNVSSGALRIGRYEQGPLAIRLAAMRDDRAGGGYRERHPWMLVGGLSGMIGMRAREDHAAVAVTRDARRATSPGAPRDRPSLHWEWNATGQAHSPDLRRGAALVAATVPLREGIVMTARHERLAPGFGSSGAVFASLDGVETSEIALLGGVGRSRVMLGADILAPFRRLDALSGAPFDDASREVRGRARWVSSTAARGELSLEGSVGSYRYGEHRLGPYPGGAVSYTSAAGRDWRWQLVAHAEGTPLFATLAPARAGGVRAAAERRSARHATSIFMAAERVDACGEPTTGSSGLGTRIFPAGPNAHGNGRNGCNAAGDVLALSTLHTRRLHRDARLELEARWQRQRASIRDLASSLEGPHRFEWRGSISTPMLAGTMLSGSTQCGFESPRLTCDMSLVVARSLFTRRAP